MRFSFKIQKYQSDAVDAIINVFRGEQFQNSQYRFDVGDKPVVAKFDDETYEFVPFSDIAYSNHPITLSRDQLLKNIQEIQNDSEIKKSSELIMGIGACSLDINMETGTGKTYVYIKTMFELYKHYGWSKFIVVVPSIAIREGVKKSFEITQQHFIENYHDRARFFVYDSKNLNILNDFSQNSGINVIIINSQAFATSLKEGANNEQSRIIYSERDEFGSRRPIDVIRANNPIVILDEPQKLSGSATQKALKEQFNPLFSINFSATHKVNHNLVYALDARDAYNQKLVKKIEVKGIEIKNVAGTSGYLYLEDIVVDKVNPPKAKMELEVKYKTGTKRETKILYDHDELYIASGGLEVYKGIFVTQIDGSAGKVSLSDGTELYIGEGKGDVSEADLRRIQIRETINSHLDKEFDLFKKGIKCLSLFFIDEVSKYRHYEDDEPVSVRYDEIFEQEYRNAVTTKKGFFMDNPEFIEYIDVDPATVHKGYFSVDKKGRAVDSKKIRGSDYSDDTDAYDLILKNKEQLLSLEEPTRFIFSHSALSEGWDNPNVFQICALKHSDADSSNIRRRQEVGRGLRLCVDSHGTRMDLEECGPQLVHYINKLTVIASEGYDTFVKGLQEEMKESLRERPVKITLELLVGRKIEVEGKEKTIDDTAASLLYSHLLRNQLIDRNGKPTEICVQAVERGTIDLESDLIMREYSGYNDGIVKLLRETIDGTVPIPIDKRTSKVPNKINENFDKKEFQALWNEINNKYTYRVEFDSEELIGKAAKKIEDELSVTQSVCEIKTGIQNDSIGENSIPDGTSFGNETIFTKKINKSSASVVKYDLIGEIAKGCVLTRRTCAAILKRISPSKFDMFRQNPEEFISKVCKLVNEAKSTVIIEHISYNKREDKFDSRIFTESKTTWDSEKAYRAKKHILDMVFTDSLSNDGIEMEFAKKLDEAQEVCVYAKLPKEFYIPTPVGKYSPDWAIAFNESEDIRHIFFIAETKGSLDSLQLKPIEKAKIECAKKLYNIEDSKVRYHVVTKYEELLDAIRE